MCEITTLADAVGSERDNAFHRQWDEVSRDRDVFTTWVDTHIRSTTDFGEYQRSIGQQPSVVAAS